MVFIETRVFARRLEELSGKDSDAVLREIQNDLLQSPERGDLVPGLAGVRKARASLPSRGKGKRGGLRYFYFYVEIRQHIHLLFLLSKGEQGDLTGQQRLFLRTLAEALKRAD